MATVFILSSLKHSMITLFSPVPNQNIPMQKITMHLHTILLLALNYFSYAHILAVHLTKIISHVHIIAVRLIKYVSHAHIITVRQTIYF